jgi:hypothetical protein
MTWQEIDRRIQAGGLTNNPDLRDRANRRCNDASLSPARDPWV